MSFLKWLFPPKCQHQWKSYEIRHFEYDYKPGLLGGLTNIQVQMLKRGTTEVYFKCLKCKEYACEKHIGFLDRAELNKRGLLKH